MVELEKAACLANDQISRRNDSEQRLDRQRMGTTLVMGLIRAHELYITHVGDSRAYWITRYGCHQVTLDDDVASREVRLGYCTYPQALQQPGSGSLVQALGMSASSLLYPNVQRLMLDEDSVFLLCSDGLSDGDRVEEYWETEILPLLEGKTDVETVSKRLVEIGNTQNGHDNVTVGLIYVQVTPSPASSPALSEQWSEIPYPSPTAPVGAQVSQPAAAEPVLSGITTQILSAQPKTPRLLLLGIGALLGIAGLLGFLFWWSGTKQAIVPEASPSATPPRSPTASASPRVTPLRIGSWVQLNPRNPALLPPLVLLSEPLTPASNPIPGALLSPTASNSPRAIGTIPDAAVLEVISKRGTAQQGQWVQFRVCSIPITELDPSLVPGQEGWIREPAISAWVAPIAQATVVQQGACRKTPSPPASP
ncbi:MAG: hypothetical protein HC781_04390 [Leptolyngbyaceae cyanobacterium CSU_1_4]|nr:hypothetical protein [Leptolyngbyaceae cyanobacterium CSU_1_4]